MSLLTGPEIRRQLELGDIVIEPYDPSCTNPNSHNLTLYPDLKVYEKTYEMHQRWARALDERDTLERQRQALKAEAERKGFSFYNSPPPPGVYTRHQSYGLMYGGTHDWMPEPLDMKIEERTVDLKIPPEGLVLWPGVLYLGATNEITHTKFHAPMIEGRSGIGRLGVTAHITAGFGDVYFRGDWTLEIVVVHPIRVYAGVRICQIAYTDVVGEHQHYRGNYQDQRGPKASMVWKDFLKGGSGAAGK